MIQRENRFRILQRKFPRLFRVPRPRTIGIFLLIITIQTVLFFWTRQRAEAAWYDDTYVFRQRVAITNSGSAQTDYQISLTLNTSTLISAGKMQSDCDDIRITDINGKLLPHWIESNNPGCNNSATVIWTKVPSIPTAGATIYIYYGNPGAVNIEKGSQVFKFFDDFTGSTLSGLWTQTSGAAGGVTVSGGYVELKYTSSTDSYIHATFTGSATEIIEFRGVQIVNSPSYRNRLYIGNVSGGTFSKYSPSGDYGLFYDGANAPAEVYYNGFTDSMLNTSNKFNIKYSVIGSNDVDVAVTNRDTAASVYTNTAATWDQSTNIIGAVQLAATETTASDFKVDTVWVRQYAATEPTIGSPGNEEKTEAPIVYLTLNDATGQTAQDSTTNNNDATLGSSASSDTNDPTWQTPDMCMNDKCLKFDGSNDYMTASTLKGFSTGSSITIQAWFKATAVDGTQNIILDGPSDLHFRLDIETDNKVHGIFGNGAGWGDTTSGVSRSTLSANQWYFVTATLDTSADSASLYVNGILQATWTETANTGTPAGYTVGDYSASHGTYNFPGFIDDVKIYNYARSAAQVKLDYTTVINRQAAIKGASTAFGGNSSTTGPLSTGLVGYWKLDESAADSCNAGADDSCDSSGNANNGDWAGGATVTNTSKFGRGVTFDGDNDYVEVADSTPLTFTSQITMSAWVYLNATTAGPNQVVIHKGTATNYWRLRENFGAWQCIVNSGGDATDPGSLFATGSAASGRWQHVACTFDGKMIHVYTDGKLHSSVAYSGSITSGAGTLRMGANASSTEDLAGKIDEPRVYNRALSGAEITQLYNFGPGPVGHWKLDEGTGQTINDSSGNGFNGNLGDSTGIEASDPVWSSGKYGKGLLMTSADTDYANTTASATELGFPSATNAFTIALWVKTTGASEYYLFDNCNNCGRDVSLRIDNGKVETLIHDGTNGNGTPQYGSAGAYNDGKWHHFAVTWNGAGGEIVYADGIKLGSTSAASVTGSLETSNDFLIGKRAGAGGLPGSIDDVRVYNYARTPKQIIEDMNAGQPTGGSPVGSPVGYWKLDDGYGSTAQDSSDNNNDLTLTSGGWTNNGKFDKGFLGASNNRLTRSDDDDFDFTAGTDDFTLSTWFKRSTISNQEYLIDKHSTNDGYTLYMDSDGDVVCGIGDGAAAFPEETIGGTLSKNYDDDQWHHAVCVKQGTTSLRLYVDGKEIASDTSLAVDADMSNTGKLIIGDTNETDGTDEFLGTVDEIKIFRYAMTADDVKKEFTRGAAAIFGVLSTSDDGKTASNAASRAYCVPGDTSTCNPPRIEYKFDENGGSTFTDTTGNGITGSQNGNGPVFSTGKIGSGVLFDGTDDFISLSDSSNPTAYTIEAWVKPSSVGASNIFVRTNSSGPSSAWSHQIRITSGSKFEAYTFDGGSKAVTGTTTVVPNTWYHVVATAKNNDNMHLYVNGIEEGTPASIGTLWTGGDRYRIGQNSAGMGFFVGKMDQIVLYDYAKTSAQIAWDYNRGGPVAWYKFDECQGDTAYDASGNSLNGTLTPGASGNTTSGTCTSGTATEMRYNGRNGKLNNALDFDGTNDYVTIADNDKLEPTSAITLAAWMRWDIDPTTGNSWAQIIDKNADGQYQLQHNQTNTGIEFRIVRSVSGEAVLSSTALPPAQNTWMHVVGTWDGATMRLYINGKQVNSSSVTGTLVTSTSTVEIGRRTSGDRQFNGMIDDVRIYNYGLTAQQVYQIYNESAVRFAPLTGTP